jgi:hypothetical protein
MGIRVEHPPQTGARSAETSLPPVVVAAVLAGVLAAIVFAERTLLRPHMA